MPRFAALLRGVSPLNATMPALKQAFEAAGFGEVRTVLASGNVVFTARAASEETLARKAEAAMTKHLDQSFLTIVRPISDLQAIIDADPFRAFPLPLAAKRVVTFLRAKPRTKLALPLEVDGARILHLEGREVYTAYVPSPKGAVFMGLIEKTLGTEVTTRTWDTVKKLVKAGG